VVKHVVQIVLCLLVASRLLPSCDAAGDATGAWVLVWEDAFTGPALNAAEWRATSQGLNYNNEAQAYLPGNVSIERGDRGGLLVLTARKETWEGRSDRADGPDAVVSREFTSGEANTRRSWKYGRFEARVRVSGTQGLLGAVWLTPADGGWPPEMDIMEILGHDPSTVYFTNHYGTPQAHQRNSGKWRGPDFSAGFHVFALEWEPTVLRWHVDGALRFATDTGVPHEPHVLRLSLPVGPDWEGKPGSASVFPQRMEIAWVRVYQRRK